MADHQVAIASTVVSPRAVVVTARPSASTPCVAAALRNPTPKKSSPPSSSMVDDHQPPPWLTTTGHPRTADHAANYPPAIVAAPRLHSAPTPHDGLMIQPPSTQPIPDLPSPGRRAAHHQQPEPSHSPPPPSASSSATSLAVHLHSAQDSATIRAAAAARRSHGQLSPFTAIEPPATTAGLAATAVQPSPTPPLVQFGIVRFLVMF
ncbi:hypothetical protein Dimus_024666 [Dionaea muscipula]